ncbi:hypothetical protein KIPB_016860, partial [Kipferlia bialata]|eukprot:g16860.t1
MSGYGAVGGMGKGEKGEGEGDVGGYGSVSEYGQTPADSTYGFVQTDTPDSHE